MMISLESPPQFAITSELSFVKILIELIPDPRQVVGAVGRHDNWHGGRDQELHGCLRGDYQQVPH